MTKEIIQNKCLTCGNEVKKHKKFCCMGCYRIHQRKGSYSFPERSTKIKTNCTYCNKEFMQEKSRYLNNKNNFCSKECYDKDHRVERITVICKGCGKEKTLDTNTALKYKSGKQKNFYCNDSCRSKKDRVNKCTECGVEFCSFAYRKANNERGFTITRGINKTCSKRCHINTIKNNQERKDKISKAFSGPLHPNYINGCSHNDRIRKTDKKENFSKREKIEVFKRFNNKCFKCGSSDNLCVDHHLPFSMGGRLTRSNTVILCRSCNSSKNAKHPTKFYNESELKKLEKLGINHNNLFNFIY